METNTTPETYLSRDEVLQLPYFAQAARRGRNVLNLLNRYRKCGLETPPPNARRVYLKAVRLAGQEYFYRPADVHAFFAAINGADVETPAAFGGGARPDIPQHISNADAAEQELAAAGLL